MSVKKAVISAEDRLAAALVPAEEQPYQVPENWCWCHLFVGLSTSKEKTEEFSDTSVKYVGLEHMAKDGGIVSYSSSEGIKSLKNLFSAGQILYGKLRPYLNKHDVASFSGICSTDILVFDVLATTIPDYVNLFLNLDFFIQYVVSHSKGINLPRDSESIVLDASYPLPPLAEQQRIVDRVKSLFAQLDEAKDEAQAVIDGYKDRKAAILHRAFSGELTAEWREKHAVSITDWKHKKFSDLCNIVRGGSPRPAGDPKYYGGNIPFMKVADITQNNGPYVSSVKYSITESGLKKTRMVEANTLLLTNSGATLGVPAISTFRTTLNDGIAAFLNLDSESLLFFYFFWLSKTDELRAINMGAAQPNLNTNIIGSIEVDVPPIIEQHEIVRRLDCLLSNEAEIKSAAEDTIAQIDTLRQSILARAFRGELGTNDPEDEPALNLLKRTLTNPEV